MNDKIISIPDLADKYLSGEGTLSQLQDKYSIKKELIKNELVSRGYIIKSGYKLSTVVGLKGAIEEYLNFSGEPSLTKIASHWNIKRQTLSTQLKELGYEIINHHNKLKFDNHIFDNIDTEEKAYWLGFIFADGYVSDTNNFELSLALCDIEHLEKFNSFIKHTLSVKNDTFRCRLSLMDTHFVDTLKAYNCIPRKSNILKFPNINIFQNKDLIKHFIRGYFDGDGCLSYCDNLHTQPHVSILGTEDFLTELKNYLPLKFDYKLGYNNKKKSLITRALAVCGKNGFELSEYLYKDAAIYLERKYNKYLEYCRLYQE